MDASAYLSQLIALLPPGDALAREPGSVLARLLSVPAAELARVDGRVEALLLESDPARTTEMLEDWERALGLPDVCYPNFQFSRASRAWYFDGAGVLRQAAVDEPRYLFDAQGKRTDAVGVEPEGKNWIRNPWFEFAVPGTPGTRHPWFEFPVPGTPGTPPMFMGFGLSPTSGSGVSIAIAGVGTEKNVPFIDLSVSGTPLVNGLMAFFFEFPNLIPAAAGQTWVCSVFHKGIGIAGLGQTSIIFNEQDAAGNFLSLSLAQFEVAALPAVLTRAAISAVISNTPGVAYVAPYIGWAFSAGQPVSGTIRIGAPQMERGSFATSVMLPPVGAPAVTTRAADQLYIATIQERRARIIAKLIERFEPTPAAITGIAARLGDAVTVTEFRPITCELNCEVPVCDTDWAHAFQVAGAAQMVVEFTCEDSAETPLSQWRTGAYECAIRRFAPAHTVPIFSYA
ncbi:MAG: DUF2313 domain-containing protein [Roseomonas sp.]|nr:DUF2313 domain-containing protein [Roseomonas sp.]